MVRQYADFSNQNILCTLKPSDVKNFKMLSSFTQRHVVPNLYELFK